MTGGPATDGRLIDWVLMLGLAILVCLTLLTIGSDAVSTLLATVAEAIGDAR
jgi:hypothetical protein